MIRLIKLIHRVLIPELLSFDSERIKTVMIITKFEFVSYYYTKINKDSKKLLIWMFVNTDYLTRKEMIRNFYFRTRLPKNFLLLLDEWSEKMKNDKNWKGSLDISKLHNL
jgi:hypothetical protein